MIRHRERGWCFRLSSPISPSPPYVDSLKMMLSLARLPTRQGAIDISLRYSTDTYYFSVCCDAPIEADAPEFIHCKWNPWNDVMLGDRPNITYVFAFRLGWPYYIKNADMPNNADDIAQAVWHLMVRDHHRHLWSAVWVGQKIYTSNNTNWRVK